MADPFLTYPMLERAGRLGNQLWEIAGTIGLARRHGYEPLFPPDWSYRPFFSLPSEMFGKEEGTPASSLATHMGLDERQYLQDWNLFSDVEAEVKRVFDPSGEALASLDQQWEFNKLPRPVLSVHVRRGDNVFDPYVRDKHLYMPMAPVGYYLEAIADLRPEASSVACFSDDIEWCRENIPADYYHEGIGRPKDGFPEYWSARILDWIDLFLMTQCQFHVLSRSSYAWWGAWLSGDPSPNWSSPWYGPALAHIDTSLMFPPGWREWPCF